MTVTAPGHLVLCSDGLWNYLTDPELFGAAVRAGLRAEGTLIGGARALCELAIEAGGADNITVALIPVAPADFPADSPADPPPSTPSEKE